MPYYGGKRGYGKAEWIASFLPHTPDSCYIEPFAGMAGVLLARAPVKTEILNDLNGRVINWWRAVRDEPEEFGRLLEFTPFSRAEYEWALSAMDDESLPPIRRALAFHVVVDQCIVHGDSSGKASWGRTFSPNVGSFFMHGIDTIAALWQRLRYVHLECRDACDLLDRVKDCDYTVIYVDPPYPTAVTSPYKQQQFDRARCAELLMAQRGAVGISGYGDEWDVLGWRRVTRPALRRQINGGAEARMEVLWLNDKAAATRPGLFG